VVRGRRLDGAALRGTARLSGPPPIAYHGHGLPAARPALRRRAAGSFVRPRGFVDERLYRSGKQFVKFAVVGAIGTIVNLAVLKLTLELWGQFNESTPFVVEAFASGLAFAVAVVNNYLLNRRWTFRSSGTMGAEFLKFLVVSLCGLVLNELVFWVFRARLDLHVMVSQLLAIACVLPFNFIVNKLWSFRGQ
jgi:putative flippase GtrA